jgi:uncharacterized phage protein (TIGR01671 family)
MRTIKFRGLRTDGKGWVYGSLVDFNNFIAIWDKNGDFFEYVQYDRKISPEFIVHPETVSQFTGLTDKNGVDIYDQDILDNGKLVYWSEEQACYFCGDVPLCMSNSHRAIIGNLHENIRLLV